RARRWGGPELAQAGCVVSASSAPGTSVAPASPTQGPWSCSGIVLSHRPGIVLCHGAILSPFLVAAEQVDWSQRRVLLADSFSPDLRIQVLWPVENRSQAEGKILQDLEPSCPALGLNPLSSQREALSSLRQHEAQLLMAVACPQFQDAFSKVLSRAEQWHFGRKEEAHEAGTLDDELLFLHWFAFLRIPELGFPAAGQVTCVSAKSLKKGDTLFACGSPFGSFCPDIFMNTLSKGVVSNMAGEENVLILTDARCLPGTEGGGVFAASDDGLELVGVIVAPLCWKANEWVGLTLVCAVDCILENIRNVLVRCGKFLEILCPPMQLVARPLGRLTASPGPVYHLLPAVVLVECGHVWGSGVMVNSRLLLTCRHVVNEASTSKPSPWAVPRTSLVKGKVVFATKDASPYDLAVVELQKSLLSFPKPVLASKFCAGEDVNVVGFGVFGQACGPSVTSGILSAVVTVDDKPVMLQTTCAVHGGSSGGPLFATHSGELLGIVASNTRDNSVGATYPHLNFSIPITVLQPLVAEYSRTGNLGSFQELDRACDRIQVVWRLQRKPREIQRSKL
uniref:Peroxisomal leader peptide-processing protease n=1 Tax=Sphenodon punctatus TaxID=8508 RepID=A0A8D0L712_SPHPU